MSSKSVATAPDWSRWVPALMIAAVVVAYLSAIRHGGLIWDDDLEIAANPLLRSVSGLWRIWTHVGPARGGTPQYYPLTFSAHWLEYRLWELEPMGYHLVNVLLHALNAVLVWRILKLLKAPGALLAAAIFALHPVHAESVAWVIQLKNVLSGQFALMSLLCFLRFWDGGEKSRTLYWLANVLFLCALASKTAIVGLPLAILAILWWKTGRLGRHELGLIAPMLALGAGAGLVTMYVERYQAGADGPEWARSPAERVLTAGRALWFYAGKLAWPADLAFIYPRWRVDASDWRQYLFPLFAAAAPAGLWAARDKIGRGATAGVAVFIVMLAPALGFLNMYFMRYSYVADHWQYMASIGLIALFAAGASRFAAFKPGGALLLLVLGAATYRQARLYESSERIWIDTLEKNPACWLAHNNYGVLLAARGRIDEAIGHYRETLRLKSDYSESFNNWGLALASQGRLAEAAERYGEALRLRPAFADAHHNLGVALAGLGNWEEAVARYREALRIDPGMAAAQNNWGAALAARGRFDEASAHYREALRIDPEFVQARNNLGLALARQGRPREAIVEFEEALRLRPDYAEAQYSLELARRDAGRLR